MFAGPGKARAFITTAHRGQNVPFDPQLTTPGVGRADVWVFDARHLGDSLGGDPLTMSDAKLEWLLSRLRAIPHIDFVRIGSKIPMVLPQRITPEQEKALLDFVEGGKGFIPLHCASYCFLNSPKYIDLVGAQFQKHGTGTFRTTIAEPNHPILKGFTGFESWDETYVHTKHNEKNRTVLEYRTEGKNKEPWTWVRQQGNGRVFYTAWGHDERTWGNPGFQELIEGLIQQPRQQVDVAHGVTVGIDSVIKHAVVGRHADGQRLVVQQRRHRVRL